MRLLRIDELPDTVVADMAQRGLALDAIHATASSKANARLKRILDQIGNALKAHELALVVDPEGNYGVSVR